MQDGSTALMLATAKGESELVKLLLVHGADPNISDAVGRDTAGAATKAQPPVLLSYTHTHLRAPVLTAVAMGGACCRSV